jgi:hypothetical protein
MGNAGQPRPNQRSASLQRDPADLHLGPAHQVLPLALGLEVTRRELCIDGNEADTGPA